MSVFQPKQVNTKSQKQGSVKGAIAGAFISASILSAGILGSCSEKDNPIGYHGSDTTRTDTVFVDTTKVDTTRLDSTERVSPVSGYILANYESAQKILYENEIVNLSSGHKVKIDYINTDSTNNSKIVADIKVWDQNDSLVVSERNVYSGQLVNVPGTAINVELIDVDFDNQDGSVDRALLRKPRNPLKNENYGSTFAIVRDGDKTLVAFTKDGLKIEDSIDAVVFTGHEGNNRLKVKDNHNYPIDISQVAITNNVNAQVEAINNFVDGPLTFTIEVKDYTLGSTGVWEVTLPPLSALGTTVLTNPIEVPLKSKDTVNYKLIIQEVSVVGGAFKTGYPAPFTNGYEMGSGNYDSYVIGLVGKVVNGSANEVPYHIDARITLGTPNGDVRVGQHINEQGINVNATLNIKSVQ